MRSFRPHHFLPVVCAFALLLVGLIFLRSTMGQRSPAAHSRTSQAVRHHARLRRIRTSSALLQTPITLPGYGEPLALVGDPAGAGVWFIAGSKSREAIFHWDAISRHLSTYPFATSSDPLPFGNQASLTLDSAGTVWAGVQSTLVRLNPSSGAVQRIHIPQLPTDPALVGGPGGGPGQPPRLFSTHAISAVVSEADGEIAITVTFSSILLIFNPVSGQFAQVDLPAVDVPTSLNVLPAGTLVVTADSRSMITLTINGTISSSVALPSSGFGCMSGSCGVVQNQHAVQFLDVATTAQKADVGNFSVVERGAIPGAALQVGQTPVPLGGGRMVVATVSGFDVVQSSGGSVASFTLPDPTCTTKMISNAVGPVRSGPQLCQEVPASDAVDASGNVWFTSNGGTPAIYELPLNAIAAAFR